MDNYNHKGFTYNEAKGLADANGEQVFPSFCPMCGPKMNCRMYCFVKDNRIVRVAGMAEGAQNRGALCAKGMAAAEWNHSPDRIKMPLLRTGEKGEGKFREISWEEALDIIADKLKEQKALYGPESLAILSPALRDFKEISLRFLAVHGSPNHAHSGICAVQNMFSYYYTLGGVPMADIAHTDLVIYWGKQPAFSGPANERARLMVEAHQRGAKLVCVKPSVEPDVAMSCEWLPIRPGTDAALALAMLNVVMNENLIDSAFVEQWCYGYDELKAHVQQFTPEWAEYICGVPSEQIINLARMYAATPKACIETGNGLEHSASASDTIRAIASLMAITGHLDREGCNVFGGPQNGGASKNLMRFDLYTPEFIDKLVAPEMPKEFMPFIEGTSSAYYKTIESVLTGKPYKIHTLIAPSTQPLLSNRGTKNVLEALKQVDFFVTIDVMRNAEMNYADIVLPVANGFEMEHPYGVDGGKIVPRPAVLKPQGDYKTVFHFFIELAERLGYGDDFWHGSYDEFENDRLSPLGITIDELRKHPEGIPLNMPKKPMMYEKYESIFANRSMRACGGTFLAQQKVALYNTHFEDAGYAPMPGYREPAESLTGSPELLEDYPLLLSDYHTSRAYSASWLRNVPSLRMIQPEPTLEIHPIQANKRGIKNGDTIKVTSPHGYLILKAELTERIRPDTVMVLHGWGMGCSELGYPDLPVADGGANVNNLYDVSDRAFDPLVTAMSSQTLVEVCRYEG